MKHLHFDVGTAGFYGAYWAWCKRAHNVAYEKRLRTS